MTQKKTRYAFGIGLLLIVIFAIVSRAFVLPLRTVHFDEGVHALFTWKLVDQGLYYYSPWKHGPLMYYLTAPFYAVFTPTVMVGRTVTTAFSLGLIVTLYLYRDTIPRSALLVTGLAFAIHPLSVYVSTYFRTDVYAVDGALLFAGALLAYAKSDRTRHVVYGAIGVVIAITAKEVSYFVLPLILFPVIGGGILSQDRLNMFTFDRRRRTHLIVFVAITTIGSACIYAGWPPRLSQAVLAPAAAIYRWLPTGGGGGLTPNTFYISYIVANAPVVTGFALIASIRPLLSDEIVWWQRGIFISWAGGAVFVLSLHSHQSVWDTVHIFAPLAMLAGIGVSDVRSELSRWNGLDDLYSTTPVHSVVVFGVVLLLAVAFLGGLVAFVEDIGTVSEPHEHSEKELQDVRRVALQTSCPVLFVGDTRVSAEHPLWPLKYYVRDLPYGYVTEVPTTPPETARFQVRAHRYTPVTVGGRTLPFLSSNPSGTVVSRITTSRYMVVSLQPPQSDAWGERRHIKTGDLHIYTPAGGCDNI